jgi:hypothetical protein
MRSKRVINASGTKPTYDKPDIKKVRSFLQRTGQATTAHKPGLRRKVSEPGAVDDLSDSEPFELKNSEDFDLDVRESAPANRDLRTPFPPRKLIRRKLFVRESEAHS